MNQDCGQRAEKKSGFWGRFARKMDRTFSFLSNYFGPSCLSTQAPSSAGEGAAPSFLCLMQASSFTELNYKV